MVGEKGKGDQENGEKGVAEKYVICERGDNENIDKVIYKRVKSGNGAACTEEIDDAVSFKDKTVKKSENEFGKNDA